MSNPLKVENLRFECTGCGKCCTGFPGYVWVTEEEIISMADHLDLDIQTFADRYLRNVEGRLSLREIPVSHSCVFLKENKCSIYDHRPSQCRTFPFWAQNLESMDAWRAAAKTCEGIHLLDK